MKKKATTTYHKSAMQHGFHKFNFVRNRGDYIKKLSDIISDTSKFKKLSSDLTLLREGQLQRFLRKLKNKEFFTKEVHDKIYPSGSKTCFCLQLTKNS